MKTDRLIGILSVLLQRDRVTAPWLAERFEVSRRTIQRDIEALCRAGIPIATAQGAGGGIRIMEGYRMDRSVLTNTEIQAILAGLRSLDSVSGTRRYAALMEKLRPGASAVMPGDGAILINLASWHKGALSEKIETIHAAIDGAQTLRFRYYSPGGESRREIEPCWLVFQWSSWYVWGWCRARRDWRLFKLNRMTGLETGGPFERRDAPLPDFSPDRAFPENFRVRMLIRPEYEWRLVEEYGPDSYTRTADGRLLFETGFADREQALGWALSFREGAELLEPESLREALRETGARLVAQYGGKDDAV